jgi:cell division GTPase FtsZ
MDATDASIALFNEYEAVVDQVKTLVGASASLPVYPSDTDNDVSLRAAIDRLKKYAENYKGDVNGDGVVDVADIASIIDIMAGNGQSSMGSGQQSADVNGDGTVDVADIAMVISIMAGSH